MNTPLAQLVITVVGLVGLATIIDLFRRGRRWTALQRLLRLKYGEPIDLVLNSAVNHGRPLAAVDKQVVFGSVKSAALFSQAIGNTRSRKELRLHLSEAIEGPLVNDLVMLGGTVRSKVGRMYLRELESHLGGKLVYFDEDDESANRIVVDDYEVVFNWTQAVEAADSDTDYALIIAWLNPFSPRLRRAFWISGFTSFGTHAALDYLLGEFLNSRSRLFRLRASGRRGFVTPLLGQPLPGRRPWARERFWPAFAMALQIQAVNGQCILVKEMKIARLSMWRNPSSLTVGTVEDQGGLEGLGANPPPSTEGAGTPVIEPGLGSQVTQ